MRYILVTLVGGHKLYSMPLFWEYISKLDVLPSEILVSCTKDIFDECMESYNIDVPVHWIHGPNDLGDDMIRSTTSAREALRQAIISKDYEWSLWLDNDILVPPNLIEKFNKLLQLVPDPMYVNAFHPARQGSNQMRHGLGSSFISKEIMEAHPFTMATIRGKNLGDDYLWKIIMSSFHRVFKFNFQVGIFFDVKHLLKDGTIHEFTGDSKEKLL